MKIFFKIHDPTTLNRQGADVGTQYRSAIFYHNKDQQEISSKIIKDLDAQGAYPNKIVTTLERFENYVKAEDYHQNYFTENQNSNQYCTLVIQPKLDKFKQAFSNLLK